MVVTSIGIPGARSASEATSGAAAMVSPAETVWNQTGASGTVSGTRPKRSAIRSP